MMNRTAAAALAALGIGCAGCQTAGAERGAATASDPVGIPAGYLYPAPNGSEVVSSIVADTLETPPFEVRVQLVTRLTQLLGARPYPPLALPATEGDDQTTLVFLDSGGLDVSTPYEARAMVAQMSAAVRNNPLFEQYGVENYARIFDLLKIVGFERVVITNGDDFAYMFIIE